MHVTILCGNSVCMVAFLLALFSLRKKSFSWLIEYLLCRIKVFFMKNVKEMRIGELSTIFNLGSEKVYSKHVWYAYIGLSKWFVC